jgi:hypothetical protein
MDSKQASEQDQCSMAEIHQVERIGGHQVVGAMQLREE